ncbi:response regulator [candidate division KSB1 bacterium]
MEKIKTTSKQRNILFVDSDKGLIRDLEDYLAHHEIKEKFGLDFIFAETCKGAMKKIAEMEIDLVVLEILLPVVNGYYLLNAIKKESKKIPVIVYTKLKGPQDLAKLASCEVDNIFVKQLMKMEDLVQMIISHEDNKVELDKVLLELQSQIKSISESDAQSDLKVVQCPRCNMILSRDSHFCNNCGQKIFQTSKNLQVKEPAKEQDNNKK